MTSIEIFGQLSFVLMIVLGSTFKLLFALWVWWKLKTNNERKWPLYVATGGFFFDAFCFIYIMTQIVQLKGWN